MVRKLQEDDAPAYVDLRRESLLKAPLALTSSPEDDFASSVEAVRELLRQSPNSVIFGAFVDRLIGVVGLYRDRHVKAAHRTHLWGMYVSSANRGHGIARKLLEAAINHARSLPGVGWILLSVSSAAPEARRLYEGVGFRIWGTEPDALRHEGQSVVEYHMALQLDTDSAKAES